MIEERIKGVEYPSISNILRVKWDMPKWCDFMVHFDVNENLVSFEVYPVNEYGDLSSGTVGFCYVDKENEPEERDEFEKDKCVMKLEGTFCSRGVWEGRLYFTDQEYWGEEIEVLSYLYNNCIVPWCKDVIKKNGYSSD